MSNKYKCKGTTFFNTKKSYELRVTSCEELEWLLIYSAFLGEQLRFCCRMVWRFARRRIFEKWKQKKV